MAQGQRKRRTTREGRPNQIIGFKAFKDTDADLIAWWQGMPDRERSKTLKMLIRAAIKPQPAAPTTTALEKKIDDLTRMVRDLMTRGVAVAAVPAQPQGEQLGEGEMQRRREKLKKQGW